MFKYNRGFSFVNVIIAIVIAIILLEIGLSSFYSYMHSKIVVGTVESIHNLNHIGVRGDSILYSFAVSIETETEIFSFSAEDRQWGSIKVGDKVSAKAFPYAPWSFRKSGTYHGGRLLKKYK